MTLAVAIDKAETIDGTPEPDAFKGRAKAKDSTASPFAKDPLKASLDEGQAKELVELEQIITTKLGAFIEVGKALMQIQTARLYKPKYKSFALYCQERWGF